MESDRSTFNTRPSPRRPPILVGRAPEQIFLREELAAAATGHGRFVLLGGEAGIGKTTLAQDLVRSAEAQNRLILTGQCYDLSNTPPYGPWLDLFATYPDRASLPAPPAAFASGVLNEFQDQSELFAAVRQFFIELTGVTSVLLLLEDLHWADPASLELLRHITHNVNRWPLLVVATYRADELGRHNSFYRQLPALVRESDGFRLDLRRLEPSALRALVMARYALSAADQARLAAYLEQHSDGNPFFATELLRSVEEEGLLQVTDGEWELGGLDRVVVPSFVRQVIEGRVARLDEAVREPLAIAAVIGQDVPLTLWAAVAGLDDDALSTIIEQAFDAHLLANGLDCARVRFVHALTREALYEGIPPPRRRRWHRQAAEALLAGPGPDPDAVAYHLQQAGDSRAPEWLVKAADRAQRGFAWATAVERLRAATDLLNGIEGAEQRRARLLHRLGRLRRFANPADALSLLDEAGRLATILGDAILAAEILYVRGVVLSYADRFREGLAAMTAAADTLEAMPLEMTREVNPTDPWVADALPEVAPLNLSGEDEAARLLHAAGLHFRRSTHPWFLATVGCLDQAIALSTRYINTLADAPGAVGGVRSTACFSYHGLGIANAARGDPKAASQAWKRAREIAAEYGHYPLITFTLLSELRDVAMTYNAISPAERRRLAQEAEATLGRAGGAFCPGMSPQLAHLGCLVLDGEWNAALRILEALPEPSNAILRREITATSAFLAYHRGDPETAWAQIHALLPTGPATGPGDHIHQEVLFLKRLAADLSRDAGDLPSAHAWLTSHDAWLTWNNAVLGQAEGRLAWARYLLAMDDRDASKAAAEEALALASEPDQPLVRLATHRFLGELDTAQERYAAADAHLMAALDLADLCQAPFERALTLLAIAELRAAQGSVREATAILPDVHQVCDTLGAAPTLARIDALAVRLANTFPATARHMGLTRREVEVLHLLARRQTDKEIAETLYLGQRTIQSHVAHILTKLNVANRREAALKAEQLGLL